MKVLLVTSWDTPCGIAEHGLQLKTNIERADPDIEITPSPALLDPLRDEILDAGMPDVLFLNYHRALHSRWTPDQVRTWRVSMPVVIDFHDTIGEHPPDDLIRGLLDHADAFIVHEPCVGLDDPRVHLIRQGVPAPQPPTHYGSWRDSTNDPLCLSQFPQQPVLGTVGFNFPWKNYDALCRVTAAEGWAIVILSNNATEADEARWRALNPASLIVRRFLPQSLAVSYLAGCDATAFCYTCANTGTSGAIRQGIAACKPVIAFRSCRQFRDLRPERAITWIEDWADLPIALGWCPIQRVHPGIVSLAHRDSWVRQGQRYAQILREVMGR